MSDNFAQTVKQQADIVRIIGDYVKLRKSGAQNYSGLCPFHKEKTGSFSVNATHGYFYCFGCHEKGDVFTFVMKLENISFPEAIRVVSTKCGLPLPRREFNSPEEGRSRPSPRISPWPWRRRRHYPKVPHRLCSRRFQPYARAARQTFQRRG